MSIPKLGKELLMLIQHLNTNFTTLPYYKIYILLQIKRFFSSVYFFIYFYGLPCFFTELQCS